MTREEVIEAAYQAGFSKQFAANSIVEFQKFAQVIVELERERCVAIAQIEHMTPKDIARVIRSNWPQE